MYPQPFGCSETLNFDRWNSTLFIVYSDQINVTKECARRCHTPVQTSSVHGRESCTLTEMHLVGSCAAFEKKGAACMHTYTCNRGCQQTKCCNFGPGIKITVFIHGHPINPVHEHSKCTVDIHTSNTGVYTSHTLQNKNLRTHNIAATVHNQWAVM